MIEKEFIEQLYDLGYGYSTKINTLRYTRVPGGWICETLDYGNGGSITFIPFVKKENL